MLNVAMLNIAMLSVIKLSVIILNVIMVNVVIVSVNMFSVVAPSNRLDPFLACFTDRAMSLTPFHFCLKWSLLLAKST